MQIQKQTPPSAQGTSARRRWHPLSARVLAALLLLIVFTVLGSWLLSVLGLDVPNMLSSEGLRWLFRWPESRGFGMRCQCVVAAAVGVGALLRSGLCQDALNLFRGWHLWGAVPGEVRPVTLRQRRALWLALLTCVLAFGLLALLFLLPASPLRSATGRLWPSPFLSGLIQAVVLGLIVTGAVYGATSRHLRTLPDFISLSYHGLQRYAPWLVCWYLAELLCSLLC
ncbi:MAG: AbgT family transporter [Bacteroidaceae bacterium]|nr:AbgT family transporter [Bacteroidaceae bacterium]